MLEELKEIICNYVEVDPGSITEDKKFIEDLGFNSYDFMCMVGDAEEKFGISVQERDLMGIKTVGDALRYIQSLQG